MLNTSDQSEFLASIIQNPDDDTVRLVFADWLEERGEWERAEYIRLSIELEAMPSSFNRDKIARVNSLFQTINQPIGKMLSGIRANEIKIAWCRGFPHTFRAITAEEWLKHADALAWHPSQNRPCPETAQPIREVVLTTMPVTQTMEVTHSGNRCRYDRVEWVDIVFDYADAQSQDHLQRMIHDQMLRSYWPGIKFTLPQPRLFGNRSTLRGTSEVYVGGEYIGQAEEVTSNDLGEARLALDGDYIAGFALQSGRTGSLISIAPPGAII